MLNQTDGAKYKAAKAEDFGTRRFALPWDLSEWVARDQLWRWTIDEVNSLAWDAPELAEFLAARPDYQPQGLLALVSYAYCIGVFEDEEVAELAFAGPPAATMGGALSPGRRAVAEFRRANRGLVKWVLVSVFRRVLRAQFQVEGTTLPAGLKRYLVRAATARLDLARTMIRGTEEA